MAEKVLVIVSEDHTAELMQKHLRGGGYGVEVLTWAEIVIQRLESEKPDLIVCEDVLPGLSGAALLLYAKANERLQAIPFLLVASRSAVVDMEGFWRLIRERYDLDFSILWKPFPITQLVERADKLLGKERKDKVKEAAREAERAVADAAEKATSGRPE